MGSDQALEQKITVLGLTAPRVTPDQIDALMRKLSYHTYVIPGTTTTIAAAMDSMGFVVALGMASCVSPANFREVLGRDMAISKAKAAAADELWKLEGYRLSKNIQQASSSGLLAGLGSYRPEELAGDVSFVGDVASGFCVASLASPSSSTLGQQAPAHHDGAPEKV